MKFKLVDIQRKVGGPEYYILKELWKHGRLYIINSTFTGIYTQLTENHAFVYSVDYTGPDSIRYGSIVDNQKNTHLFVIEKIDVLTVAKVRQICNNLFSGERVFTYCYKVTNKQGEA